MNFTDSEIGYPHELILRAKEKAKEIVNEDYNKRTKFFAFLLLELTGENINPDKLLFLNHEEKLLFQIAKGKSIEIKNLKKHKKENFEKLIEQYKRHHTQIAIDKIKDFLQDSLFTYIFLKSFRKTPIIDKKVLNETLPDTLLNLTPIKEILMILTIYEDRKLTDNQLSATLQILLNEQILQENSIYFSLQFATLFLRYKKDFLLVHYLMSKKIIESQLKFITERNLADEPIEKSFKTALILSLCGYKKSIRLSYQEKINYAEQIIGVPVLAHEFEKCYDSLAKIGIERYKIPIKYYSLIVIIVMILGIILDITISTYVDVISIFGLETSIPLKIPYLSVVSLILVVILTIKLFKLKKEISVKLMRGD
ncbi:MAG: hypothetical protein K9W42_06530 [Candidatus Heimdallarchaeota archaeon]|nr:hypothetical protein [Candidatus Heimdallarchaeota archaeon]